MLGILLLTLPKKEAKAIGAEIVGQLDHEKINTGKVITILITRW